MDCALLLEFTEQDYLACQSGNGSRFDQLLKHHWASAYERGVMNYCANQGSLPCRIVSPAKYSFIVMLIEGRSQKSRRSAQEMHSVRMEFDSAKFNFTKVKLEEILFKIQSDNLGDKQLEASIIVNKFPIQYCSALLVPSLTDCLPQVLTTEALVLAISVLFLSDDRSLRLGYNSPGAMASVNHLHWHLYYMTHRLKIEDLPVVDHLLQNWTVPAIVFELTHHSCITKVASETIRIIEFCLENNLAHNLFLTRTTSGSIRLFLWVIEPRLGAKDDNQINVGFCEFSGFFIVKDGEQFDSIDEGKCLEIMDGVESKHHKVLHLL